MARKTWLRYPKLSVEPQMQARMAYRFFVGTSPNLSLEDKRRLAEEATVYGDIIMLDTLDTYNRLPFKTLEMMRWLTALHNQNFTCDYVLKTDDDSYVRLDRLHYQLDSIGAEDAYWGFFNFGATKTEVKDTDKGGKANRAKKWTDPIFNGTHYPPYALGAGYALSMPLIARIVREYEENYENQGGPPSQMEDACTGILLDTAPGRVRRIEVWWRSSPAIKSGSNNPLCEEHMVLRSHVHDVSLMRKWTVNYERCFRMCSCENIDHSFEWQPENDLDYTFAQLRWIGKRKEAELNRLQSLFDTKHEL